MDLFAHNQFQFLVYGPLASLSHQPGNVFNIPGARFHKYSIGS